MNPSRRPVETRSDPPPGLEPLAVLPLFIKLQGRRAVLVGGNAGAAWKARLLAAAGAEVDVFAINSSDEMRAAGEAVPVAGRVTIWSREWRPDDLDGAALAIAALDDEDEARAFVAAARARGVIVNAVDRPHLCDVQFGAIVNRSPLVVGISTEGAAPVLGQAIRSAIEGLLPRGLALWTAAAKGWRDRVRDRLASFAERRRFWERFAALAFAEPNRVPDEADFARLAAGVASVGGSVTLVGAGPGDPELLTLKAVRALRTADVILYDDLVAPAILDFARREAKTMLVGKTGHGPSCRQDEINALMVRLAAREGRRVVRLKGGDPLVFDRATEETAACREAGVPVEIMPGITSAQGAAASLGVSLTDRALARRVQFVTGHDHRGGLPEGLNWDALADPAATTVIYMPRRTLALFLGEIGGRGLPPTTAAVAILNATRPNETVVRATVGTLVNAISTLDDGPVLVLVGEALRSASARPQGAEDNTAYENERGPGLSQSLAL